MRCLLGIVVLAAATLTACSDGSGLAGDPTEVTGFEEALSRIAATDATRTAVSYDDTATLVEVAGATSYDGYGYLRGLGAPALAAYSTILAEQASVDLAAADFTISAGEPPGTVGLVAGGQDADAATSGLTAVGYEEAGDHLVAPALAESDPSWGALSLAMAQVRLTGSDAVYGYQDSDLADGVDPSEPTLADDPLIAALANCLGDVVAAQISTADIGAKPTAVAVGVRIPDGPDETAQATVCVSWADEGAADRYAENLPDALSADSPGTGQPYADLLTETKVTNLGGDAHVVSLTAATPDSPFLIFQMLARVDLPGLPDCGRLTPEQREAVDQYC